MRLRHTCLRKLFLIMDISSAGMAFNEAQAYMPEKARRQRATPAHGRIPSMRLRHTCLRKTQCQSAEEPRRLPSMRLRHTCLRKPDYAIAPNFGTVPSMRLRHTCLRKAADLESDLVYDETFNEAQAYMPEKERSRVIVFIDILILQ